MHDAHYMELKDSLAANAQEIFVHGAPAEVRNCHDRMPGQIDPRSACAARATRAAFRAEKQAFHPELRMNEDKLFGPERSEFYTGLVGEMRLKFGWRSTDLSSGIRVKSMELATSFGTYPVWWYEQPESGTERPCLVFIHGGGFVAGDTATVENQCKLLAQLSGAVVLSVDYPLAPEHPYPAGFEACYHTVKWAYEHTDLLGIDKQRIGVAGDSAGGNLSLACALRDRDEQAGRIHYQALIYPLLTRSFGPEDPHYYWSEAQYDNPFNDPIISEQMRLIGKQARENCGWYLPSGADRYHPYISPITGACEGLPKTLLMTAEYDYLRAECDVYLGMLHQAHVPVRAIRYGGIFHGTFDRLGYAPQVEDMLSEIAKDLKELP